MRSSSIFFQCDLSIYNQLWHSTNKKNYTLIHMMDLPLSLSYTSMLSYGYIIFIKLIIFTRYQLCHYHIFLRRIYLDWKASFSLTQSLRLKKLRCLVQYFVTARYRVFTVNCINKSETLTDDKNIVWVNLLYENAIAFCTLLSIFNFCLIIKWIIIS